MASCRSAPVGAPRNACVDSDLMISAAHASSSAFAVGRHEKIFNRLGVSDTPVTSSGPWITKSRRCGSIVTPQVMLTSASVFSSGISRSSTGPSSFCTKAAVTRCGPALMCTGGVTSSRPFFGSVSLMRVFRSTSATRSPFTENSTCSLRS